MHFVGFGHSHIVALAKGAYTMIEGGAQLDDQALSCRFHYLYDPAYEPSIERSASGQVLNTRIADALSQEQPAFAIVSIGGNEHNILAISKNDPPFDFILGEQPDLVLSQHSEILPEAAVREALSEWMQEKLDILKLMRAACSMPVIQIEPPPPLPREQVLAYPKEFFRSALQARKLSADTLRYKMWRVQVKLLRGFCAEHNVAYIETPTDFCNSDGLLAAPFWGKDATHANDLYGEEMMKKALALVSGMLNISQMAPV